MRTIDITLGLAALEAVDQAVCVVDIRQPDQPLVYVNPAFSALTGFSAESMLGNNCRFLQGTLQVEEQRAAIRSIIRAGMSGTVVIPNERADGSMFVNELSLSPIRDGAGEITHYAAVQRDVTARTLAELARDRLDQERSELADQLQRNLVPRQLPRLEEYRVAVRYLPAARPDGTKGEVSGDFYDLVARPDGGWFAVLGDVSGRGPRAAATGSAVRWVLRGAVAAAETPAELLEQVGRAAYEALEDRFATMVAAALPPPGSGGAVQVALAGHPQPVLLPPEGEPELVGVTGTLVGPFPVEATDVTIDLPVGGQLVLYSDGATEAVSPSGQLFDETGIAAALGTLTHRERIAHDAAERTADTVVAAVEQHLGGRRSDDLTLVVLHRVG